ncbi:MAG: S-layer homology domain-containing protein, partial [Acidimicrobiia bacterium]|nr:S-layer homology domain-containing protein [Acidimicrobiia bacterium]
VYGLRVTNGTSDTTYSPHNPVTRAQMASFLTRLYRSLTTPSQG